MRWALHAARIEDKRNAYWILVGKTEGRLGRPRHRWDDNIKLDLKHRIGRRGVD
jgi:hypothetical protein